MQIDHIHFFVEDAVAQRNWLITRMGWQLAKPAISLPVHHLPDTHTEYLRHQDLLFVVSSPLSTASPVATYLQRYAPGIADVAVRVPHLAQFLSRARACGCSINLSRYGARVSGWGGLSHTVIEQFSGESQFFEPSTSGYPTSFHEPPHYHATFGSTGLDHLVLNVPAGELQAAVQFYQSLFELHPQQTFQIQTSQSGLHSQVLYSPDQQLYFNINEPASKNSQIQIFLDAHRGSGIQHIALKSHPLVDCIAQLRQRRFPLLPIAASYYQKLRQRLQSSKPLPLTAKEWSQLIEQQILIDWRPERPDSILLQTFSKPIFQQPTFFLSLLSGDRKLKVLEKAISWHFTRLWKQNWHGRALKLGLSQG